MQDLGVVLGPQGLLGGLIPEPVAVAWAEATGTSGTLVGSGPGYPQGGQPAQAAVGIETEHPAPAGINNDADPFDSEAGFGNGGCQHQAAPAGGEGGDGPAVAGLVAREGGAAADG